LVQPLSVFARAGFLALVIGFGVRATHAENVRIPTENPQGPDLGKVAQAPAASSVWRIDPDSGDVSLLSGDATRLTSGPSSPPQITIDCSTNACRHATLIAAFSPAAAGRATILGFTPGHVSSRGLTLQTVSGAGTTHLLMTFLVGDVVPASADFPLGLTVRLTTGADSRPNYSYTMIVTMH
jgi:hypothetical protein